MAHKYKYFACSLNNVTDDQILADIHYLDSCSNYREYLPHSDSRPQTATNDSSAPDPFRSSRTHELVGPVTWILGSIFLIASVTYCLYS